MSLLCPACSLASQFITPHRQGRDMRVRSNNSNSINNSNSNNSSSNSNSIISNYTRCIQDQVEKVNKKRTGRVRRVIILLNISKQPLLICLHCCLHQHKPLKAVVTSMAAIVVLTPAKNLNKVFWGFLGVFPLFNHFLGYV
jgi:hypothetical protein